MANFEVFRWNISSSINLLFLKSAILAYRISNFVATLFYITLVECKIFIHKYLPRYSVFFPQNRSAHHRDLNPGHTKAKKIDRCKIEIKKKKIV